MFSRVIMIIGVVAIAMFIISNPSLLQQVITLLTSIIDDVKKVATG
jgi:hypothetical protein